MVRRPDYVIWSVGVDPVFRQAIPYYDGDQPKNPLPSGSFSQIPSDDWACVVVSYVIDLR